MAGIDEADDNRLRGRAPRSPRRAPVEVLPDVVPDPELPDDHEIETVTKLMGFLRSTDDET